MKYSIYLPLLFLFACNGETESQKESKKSTIEKLKNPPAEVPDESELIDAAIPIEMGLRKVEKDEIPAHYDYEGSFNDCWTWDDKNGVNYLIRTIEEKELVYPENDWADDSYDQTLHVYHFAHEGGLLRELTDFEKNCPFDLDLKHLDDIELNDLDDDGEGEIMFGYWMACRSDVSPSEQKIVIFENGDKYILRGWTVAMGYGGNYEIGGEFENAPNGFLAIAEDYWENHKVEY